MLRYHTHAHRLTGKELEGCEYKTPFGGKQAQFLPGLHVTSSAGTGLVMMEILSYCAILFQVHTAPAHGQDDYQVGIKQGLSLDCQVHNNSVHTICTVDLQSMGWTIDMHSHCRLKRMAVIQAKWDTGLRDSLSLIKTQFNLCLRFRRDAFVMI